MEISAYSELYLDNAQKNLAHMMDFAVNTCEIEADDFFEMFLVSGIAEEFGSGNPAYVCGMTGCELVRKIAEKADITLPDVEDVMYLDKSPEYWCGWVLAYYQWKSGESFSRIQQAVPVSEVIQMYPVLHEADVSKFTTLMKERLNEYYKAINLKRIRMAAGYSQSELARDSGVNIRQIQMYEQEQRDINKAQAETLLRLSRVLGCKVEDLMESGR
ncbi:MAG: helix-turn-helix domain-containing protein [Lachnospiraceae bacterium]